MTQRARLLDVITVNVRYLARLKLFGELEEVMDSIGYLSNRKQTCDALADAIIALAGTTDREHLIMTAHSAVFLRHFNYENRSDCDWDLADKLADDALAGAGIDVERRNAKAKADEERARAARQAPARRQTRAKAVAA